VLIGDDAALDPISLFAEVASCSGLLLAVSGGPDSMALMRLAAAWRDASVMPPRLAAATVDHGLRPEAAAEARKVSQWSSALGVPHAILTWTGEKPTARIQERARVARYRLLFSHMREIEASALVTAHHADDQWETVMMRLSRGSGIAGLAGMSRDQTFVGGRLVRPLLNLSKATLVRCCHRYGQEYCSDPSNDDPRFARSQWRDLAAPLHRAGLTRERVAKFAERAQKYDRALVQLATQFMIDAQDSFESNAYDLAGAKHMPQAIIEYFLQSALARASGAPPARLERVERLAGKLIGALRAGTGLRATLGGCTVVLSSGKKLRIGLEPPRKRGL
jgi:tRNA(Ile)-lysidine synthase